MDFFSPCQFSQVHRWLTRKDASDHGRARCVVSSTTQSKPILLERRPNLLAFVAIGSINASVFAYKELMLHSIRRQTSLDWSRWITKYRWRDMLPFKDYLFNRWWLEPAESQGVQDWLRKVALQPVDSRWWTYISANFVHLEGSHIGSNMALLAACAEVCSKLPNMTPLHVFVVTIGSGVAGSLAMKYWWFYNNITTARCEIGASPIVSGFVCLTAVAAPMEYISLSLGLFELRARYWFFATTTMIIDVLGSFGWEGEYSQRLGQAGIAYEGTAHAAHLGGALFGVAYYYLVLRTRGAPQPEVTPNSPDAPASTVLTASQHYGVPNSNLVWSDQLVEESPQKSEPDYERIRIESKEDLTAVLGVEQTMS